MPRIPCLPALAVTALVAMPAAGAEPYPARPIRLVVPLATGGATDTLGRLVAQRLSEGFGQPVIVDNRPGAGGNLGNEAVARAQPDGYTLLMAAPPLVINPGLYRTIGYHPVNDFTPITLVASVPVVLAVHPAVPARSVKELIALATAQPGRYNYGSSGIGGSNHLAGAMFASKAGVEIVHVAYRGSAPALTDLLAGQVHMQFSGLPPLLPLIKAGRLRALGVAGSARAVQLPDVPTIAEAGLAGYEVTSWQGLAAPAKLPRPLLTLLHGRLATLLASPDVQARIVELGADPAGNSPAEFARFIRQEFEKWGPVIRQTGARAE